MQQFLNVVKGEFCGMSFTSLEEMIGDSGDSGVHIYEKAVCIKADGVNLFEDETTNEVFAIYKEPSGYWLLMQRVVPCMNQWSAVMGMQLGGLEPKEIFERLFKEAFGWTER